MGRPIGAATFSPPAAIGGRRGGTGSNPVGDATRQSQTFSINGLMEGLQVFLAGLQIPVPDFVFSGSRKGRGNRRHR